MVVLSLPQVALALAACGAVAAIAVTEAEPRVVSPSSIGTFYSSPGDATSRYFACMDMQGAGPGMPPDELREIVRICRQSAFGTPGP